MSQIHHEDSRLCIIDAYKNARLKSHGSRFLFLNNCLSFLSISKSPQICEFSIRDLSFIWYESEMSSVHKTHLGAALRLYMRLHNVF